MKNLINRIARFVLRGICIEVDITDKRTGKTKHISRYVGKEAFDLMRMRAQQELHQMHQAALDEQVKTVKDNQ